jgi:hypothetical protein
MLQTSCPKCKGTIQSPYLNDLSTIECPECSESVAVDDVFIATKGFTMHRGDLLNRISRFQRLLREVEKERASMENDDSVSAKTRKSVEQFYQTLQELLAGARNHFRLEIPSGLSVEIGEEEPNSAKVTNLSSEGASIACEKHDRVFRTKQKIKLQMPLPGASAPLSCVAEVVWVSRPAKDSETGSFNIGVKFVGLDENIRARIWNFIIESAQNQPSPSAA